MELLSTLLLVLPLTGFLITGLGQKRIGACTGGILASATIFVNAILALILFVSVSTSGYHVETKLFDWIKFSTIDIPFSLSVDRLSALMLLIINGVGLLIHLYSIGYMKGDEGSNRFFSYLNLFVFFMLILVLSSNFLMLFIGWEGVGLCSYLLIGFWNKDHANNDAAKKAFIINRIGDLGFLVAVFLIYSTFGTLTIADVVARASVMASGAPVLTAITLCLFIGATGKSAQLPLFTWLPDAMAGPTPVSALIHAATMVTAGIYLIARTSVLFVLSPVTMNIVLVIGAATALIGGLIAIFQYDIKKVLAYSTVSQLGFMFLALGLGSFQGAMFHLTTHAFFKALLFLAAGSVIHALNGEQDIRNMGDLRKKIPFTFVLFLIGTIAISGVPPFAGFFSKEQILSAAYEHSIGMGVIATAISLLTTLYMFRLLFVVFFKKQISENGINHHVHESPLIMTIPMSILAVLSVVAGFVQFPRLIADVRHFDAFLNPVFGKAISLQSQTIHEITPSTEWMMLLIPLSIIVILIAGMYLIYANDKVLRKPTGLFRIAASRFYLDELYQAAIVKPIEKLSDVFRTLIDQTLINGLVNAVGDSTLFVGKRLRRLQTGNVGSYLIIMVLCIIAILLLNIIHS